MYELTEAYLLLTKTNSLNIHDKYNCGQKYTLFASVHLLNHSVKERFLYNFIIPSQNVLADFQYV